jgi:hypothetical protein
LFSDFDSPCYFPIRSYLNKSQVFFQRQKQGLKMWSHARLARADNGRSEVLAMVKKWTLVLWVETSCGLVGRYQRFGGI